ncbi:MAG TPA: FHA domain-containing protein [Blastocatellia bacterium]|nr:FHA domain-containing protein [Blastocatellia bacterium]
MIHCQQCQNENLSGAQFCDECGGLLPALAETALVPPPPSFLCDDLKPSPARPLSPISRLFEDSDDVPVSVGVQGRLLLMVAGRAGKEFFLTKPEMLIGRWDAARGIFPDVDLDEADLETKVSRRHARIFTQNNQFWIEDLGSLNGTVINRQHRLQRGQPYLLKDGDEIIVGKTFLKFSLV